MSQTSFRLLRIQSKLEYESDVFSTGICRASCNIRYSETADTGRRNSLKS